MAVDPDFLPVTITPMSRSPDVICAAYIIARPANVVRPITNRDYNGSSSVVWPRAVVGSVAGGSCVIPFAASSPE